MKFRVGREDGKFWGEMRIWCKWHRIPNKGHFNFMWFDTSHTSSLWREDEVAYFDTIEEALELVAHVKRKYRKGNPVYTSA